MAARGDVSPEDLRRFRDALASVPAHQGRSERLLRAVVSSWCRVVGWRLTVAGSDRLPSRDGVSGAGCIVAVAPHRAWVEPFLLVVAWPAEAARLVWLADGRTATRSWWRRRLLPRLGVIPIAVGAGGPRAYAEQAAVAVQRGCAVVVFPEVGPASPPARTRALSPGFAYLSLRSGAPVVPAVVAGTHRLVRGSPLSVDFCAALEPGEAMPDPLTPRGRTRADGLRRELEEAMAGVLPSRTAQADAAAPARARWRWLGSLFD